MNIIKICGKIELNSQNCPAFAMVFLRARYASATVLQMLFRTPAIPFYVDLGLMNHKKRSFLIGELKFELKLTKPAKLSPSCPGFQEKSGEILYT